jgi:hypothetical protein
VLKRRHGDPETIGKRGPAPHTDFNEFIEKQGKMIGIGEMSPRTKAKFRGGIY